MGMEDFDTWTDRLIAGSCIKRDEKTSEEAHRDSLKFAFATMLMHLPPTTDHECDGYFIKSARKAAINQIAHAKITELNIKAKARLALEEKTKGEATAADPNGNAKVADGDKS